MVNATLGTVYCLPTGRKEEKMQSVTPISEAKQSNIPNWVMGLGLAAAIILVILVMMQMGVLRAIFSAPALSDGFTLTTADFQFGTETLQVKAGETVTIYLSNQDMMTHAFDVDELDIHVPVTTNEVVPITFTATEVGSYTFYCGVSGHRTAGMVGTLVVEP